MPRSAATSRRSPSPAAPSPTRATASWPGPPLPRGGAGLWAGCEGGWSGVVVWWGDERFVEPASDDRNERQARETFLDLVDVDPAKVHPMPSTESAATVHEGGAAPN